MSISAETADRHKNDPAVLCCLTRKGTVIAPSDLEDPEIFPDMVDSGLLELREDGLTIGRALGATLKEDTDALTPLTAGLLDGVASPVGEEAPAEEESDAEPPDSGVVRLCVDRLEGLKLEFPAGCLPACLPVPAPAGKPPEEKVVRTLIQREYAVKEVLIGDRTSFQNGVLTIRDGLCGESLRVSDLVRQVRLDVITRESRHVYSNTVMDVIPVAAKAEGILGEGATNVLSGAVVVLTGTDEAGVQVHEFGSCEGYLDEKIRYGRPGCPDPDDIMIRVDVVIRENTGMERRGPYAAHKACDFIIQEIREALKRAPAQDCEKETVFRDVKRPGRPRVVLVKEIMGQGAMHDNVLLPIEPAGVRGGRQNVDLGNVPVVLSSNEVRDGGVHALTCIGPATKEDTRHYFREPLLNLLALDEELDLVGVVFIGSPQVNDEKMFVSARLGSLIEALDVDGAIVTTEGFGNNHIDFAENIGQIGRRGVPVVGVSFCAYQGQLVVGNPYMDAMVELNKDPEGFENEILGESTICPEDALRAVAMLKNKMAGVPIEPADRRWSQGVIDANQRLV